MSWKVWKEDVAADLKADVRPQFIKLHTMTMELVVDSLEKKAQAELEKDARFMVQLMGICKSYSREALQKMKSTLQHADKQAAGFTSDAGMAGMFLRPIHMEMEKYFDDACKNIKKDVSGLFADKRRDAAYLKTSSVRVDMDLKFGGLEIPQKGEKKVVGGTVKIAPLHVDIKNGVRLDDLKIRVNELVKLCQDIPPILVNLKKEVESSQKANAAVAGSSAPKEAANNAKAMRLELLETTVRKRIEKFKGDVTAAVASWKEKGKPLKDAERQITEWETRLMDHKSEFPQATRSEIIAELNKLKKWSTPMMKNRIMLSTALKDAEIAKKWETALEEVKENKSGWDTPVNEATDWCIEVQRNFTALERELKNSAAVVHDSIKKIEKLTGAHN